MPIPKIRLRSEVDPEQTWNSARLFASPNAWEEEYQQLIQELPEIEKWQGHLADSAKVFGNAMDAIAQFMVRIDKMYTYALMSSSVDATDQIAAALYSKARELSGRAISVTSFVDPELLAIDVSTLDRWFVEERQLAIYGHYIDNLRRTQRHIRSAEVEELLGQLHDPFQSVTNTATLLTTVDLVFRSALTSAGEAIPVTKANFDIGLMFHPDRELRRTAYESYSEGHLLVKTALAANLSVAVKQHVFMARARGYGSALEAALFPNNIPTEVYHNLLTTFRRHLPTWQRYWQLKRKTFGYDHLYPYDLWLPITLNPPEFPYLEAVDLISEALKPLGDEYVQILRRGCLTERWVDRAPNTGKPALGFSVFGPDPFVVLNYLDNVPSMSMLTHELGHSMHSYFTWRNQPYIYTNYSIFVAEVASNFNQALVRAHLLKTNPEPTFQIAMIEEAMNTFVLYFFFMPILSQFELDIHQRVERGEGLTADGMNARLAELLAEGYGDSVTFNPEYEGSRWAQLPQLVYGNYYMYQYVTGLAGAYTLADRVLAGVPGAADAYLSFLKAGNSQYPLDVLKQAGVDLASPNPIEKTFEVLAGLIDRLEKLTQKTT